MASSFTHVGGLRDVKQFRAYLAANKIDLPCDETLLPGPESPLGQELQRDGIRLGNRFAIQPMEGWDGTTDGRPTELTFRRWKRFGASGAKLIWGGEAVAVCHAGRANPNQLSLNKYSEADLRDLREALVAEHERATRSTADLLVGLQLTHSGRYSRPNTHNRPEPRILYHHPVLDRRLGLDADYPLITDREIREIIQQFREAAATAAAAGFAFVDIKHCHGYLGHEFLSAHARDGDYGGSFENRTRFLRETVAAVREVAPQLMIGVRVSAFDTNEVDLTETIQFLSLLAKLGIKLVNITAGSPYYNPHIQRPALYPPSDGYAPPEDPLVGVARQMHATRLLKEKFPELIIVGSAYSYLQDFLLHVAQAAVREGWTDCVGLGRMVLSYPTLPLDVLSGRELRRNQLCRTFSDCTSAPRNGMPSGCYPLDDFYKTSENATRLKQIKRAKRSADEN